SRDNMIHLIEEFKDALKEAESLDLILRKIDFPLTNISIEERCEGELMISGLTEVNTTCACKLLSNTISISLSTDFNGVF
ncbi:MAG: hypothetical protein Q7U35_07205, partial [Methanobacteriaceae archaeon]|nr:hypothetical protein [Methanobacteriaceae archaeon]